MKKILSTLLVLMLAVCLLAPAAMAEDVTITLFHNKVEIDSAIQAFAAAYSESHPGVTVKIETLGGGADHATALKAKSQANQMPEIFVIEGQGNYDLWQDYISDLSDQPWVADTDVAFTVDGKVVGFPVSIEGFGLGYNAEILEKAEIDPATLTNIAAVTAAFEKLDSMKADLGLDAVVAMGASVAGGMTWVTGNHDFSIYLGGGLAADDTSIIDLFNQGKVDEARLTQYAKYVKLLFDYSDHDALVNGNYDNQIAAFAQAKTAFIHQGNWIDPNLKQLNVTFPIGYIPHAFMEEDTTGLFLFAPSFYVVNSQAPEANQQAAKDFLTYMATTPEGADYIVNQAGMVPAFKSIDLKPTGGFSLALMEANAKGGNYAVRFGEMPDGFGMNTLGPVFELFAQDTSGEALNYFVQDVTNAVATMAN